MLLSKLVERKEEQEMEKLNKIRGVKAIEWEVKFVLMSFTHILWLKIQTNYETIILWSYGRI